MKLMFLTTSHQEEHLCPKLLRLQREQCVDVWDGGN
jgi:hypothetical protein